ncbi:MAG TPA: DUF4132 domain-containing protein [Candidatus Acidoferrum sp.]|jgi:hypothetical protein
MDPSAKQAQQIYEGIRATSGDRPSSGNSVAELTRDLNDWRAKNQPLTALSRSGPDVQLAFLWQSYQWLRAEAQVEKNFRTLETLSDAIQLSMQCVPKPFPSSFVENLVTEIRRDSSPARFYFPIERFLSFLSAEQITERTREELRKIHVQLAPTPRGKVDKHHQRLRGLIAPLIYVEGEKQTESGRGPWSQIVFDEIAGMDSITRSGWIGLLEHCHALEQAAPGPKWSKRSLELLAALGETKSFTTMMRWLALGPTPGQPSDARSPTEDSAYQKGVVLCVGLTDTRESAMAIGEFGLACLRKVPNLGAVSQKVGFACVQALGMMENKEAISQLTRMRSKVKYSVARRLIEKSLHLVAERAGMTVDELEDVSIPQYPLDITGALEVAVADCKATVRLVEDGRVVVLWQNAEGKRVKAAPAHARKVSPKKIRAIAALTRDLEGSYSLQRSRLETSFLGTRRFPLTHWRRYYVDHPLLGFLGRKLLWVFSNSQGWERSGLWSDGEIRDSSNKMVDLARAEKVRLWHPLSYSAAEVQRWRTRIFTAGLRQPFRQAFREFYQVTDDERKTRLYSNRFAGILLRQHQFANLARARGWSYQLMGLGVDGANVPSKKLEHWNMSVEFYVDLPPDRDHSVRRASLAEQSGAGINVFIGSDQVRFYRDLREIPVDDVPAIVYSEVMRDVDLFTTVAAVGDDATWSDQGDRGTGVFSERFDINDFSATTALRAEMLSRVLPRTPIADRCTIDKAWLEVKGQLGTYRIQLGWGGAMFHTESISRWLKIPQSVLNAVPLDLSTIPIDLDPRTEMILRKAFILADDWRIDAPELVRQLMPE